MIIKPARKKVRLWIAAAALGLGAMTFSAPSEARGFGGFHGGGGGFHGGMGGFHGGGGGFHAGMGGFHGGEGGFHGGMGAFHGSMGMGGFHGGVVRGPGAFHGPVAFTHRGFIRSPFSARTFVNRPFFFHRRFADRRFFFRRHRFAGPLVAGFYDGDYGYPYYAEECFWVRRHVVNPWGFVVVRRRLVCT